jgi:hypothetical protein
VLVPLFLRRESAAVTAFNEGQPSPGKDRSIQAIKECVRLLHRAHVQRALVPQFLQRESAAVTSLNNGQPSPGKERQMTNFQLGLPVCLHMGPGFKPPWFSLILQSNNNLQAWLCTSRQICNLQENFFM